MANHTYRPPDPDHMVETDLGPIAVQDPHRGRGGLALVLWPSIFTDRHIYDAILPHLSDDLRVICVDGPGHGQSLGVARPFSMGDCAASLAQVLDACGLTRAIVGGTSWGGLVAAEFGLRHPDRAAAVLMLNTPLGIGNDGPRALTRFIAFGARWLTGFRFFRDGISKAFFLPETLPAAPVYHDQFHAMLRRAPGAALGAAVRSVLLHTDPLAPRLGGLAPPALILAGERDTGYPAAEAQVAAQALPRGQFRALPTSHISVVDAPEATAQVIRDFLAETGLTPAG
ncbi:MAG: alpha/beta hydrolase [Pseudomonadota bacterium]